MNCRKFQNYINSFLNNELLDRDILKEFIIHALSCKECYDELEIYYTLQVGLELAESDASMSFDFKGEIERMLIEMDYGIKTADRVEWIEKSVRYTANIVVVMTGIMCLIKLL